MLATTPRVQTLSRFVPFEVLAQLDSRGNQPIAPRNDMFAGTVLFADISGFTSLSERLGQRGAIGVEELTQTLNSYFGDLIDIVLAAGGDIVKFAGDALLAIWRAEENEIAVTVHAAAKCGLAAQQCLRHRTTKDGDRLSLRIGIGSGSIVTASVGGEFDRWEYLVSGNAIVEATKAADAAERGEALLGPTAADRLSPTMSINGRFIADGRLQLAPSGGIVPSTPRPELKLPATIANNLLSYVPAAIHQRLDVGHGNWLGELRRLTVLFVNLKSINQTTPLSLIQDVMSRLQRALYRYEGSLNKLSSDDKGITFIAALGLPPLSHEDDELRGILAALDIKSTLAEIGQNCSIGVTSGRVYCGIIGNEKRCEYTIIGDTVNLSARLMQAAKDGILCDKATYQVAKRQVDFEILPAIALKGKAELVPVFRPFQKRRIEENRRPLSPMIGREIEQRQLDQLQQHLVNNSSGSVVIIDGEPGIGKSRFVAALRVEGDTKNIATYQGSALDMERSTPYFAWRGVFRSLFRSEGIDEEKLTPEALLNRIGHLLTERGKPAELAPLLNGVLATELPDNSFTTQLTQEARVNLTNELLTRLIQVEAKLRSIQLILEDCHWMDSASWTLTRLIAEVAEDFLLLIITRPLNENPPQDYWPICQLANLTKVSLVPLSENDVEALVCRSLGVAELPRQVADLIRVKAQGNPLFGEEIAFALRDAGVLKVQNGRCVVSTEADLERLGFPDTVQGVVTSRIDRLMPNEQLTLKVASVIGRSFSCRILQAMFPVKKDRSAQQTQLEILSQRNLIAACNFDEELDYQFRHVITQEVAYDLIPPTQRQQLHQAIAEWYEQEHCDDLSPFFAMLAKHWSRTDQTEKAIEYLEKSGESAARQFANSEVIQFFTQALKLSESSEQQVSATKQAHWNRQLAEAHYNLGDLASSLKHFRAALIQLRIPLAKSQLGTVGNTLLEFAKQFGWRGVTSKFRRFSEEEKCQRLEAAKCYERLAQIYYLNNARLHTIQAVFKALNLAESVGPSAVLARCYANAAVVAGLLFLHRRARYYATCAREVAQEINDPDCISYVGLILGIYWFTVGEWDVGEEGLTEAIQIAEKLSARRRWAESAFTLVIGHWRRGYLSSCRTWAQKGSEVGRRERVPQVQLWGLSWCLRCSLAQSDDWKQHEKLIQELKDCLKHDSLAPADQILGHGLLAAGYWRLGKKALAYNAATQVSRVIQETNQICHYVLPAYSALFEVYCGLLTEITDPQQKQVLKRHLKHIRKSLREFGMMYPVGKVSYQLHEGQYHWHHGSQNRALKKWQKALRLAHHFRMPFAEGLVHWELACHSPQEEKKQQHRHLAETRFQETEAWHYLNQLKRATSAVED